MQRIKNLEERLQEVDDDDARDQIKRTIVAELDYAIEEQKIRAKAINLDNNDKPTRFLLQREKIRGDRKVINMLMIDGKEINTLD